MLNSRLVKFKHVVTQDDINTVRLPAFLAAQVWKRSVPAERVPVFYLPHSRCFLCFPPPPLPSHSPLLLHHLSFTMAKTVTLEQLKEHSKRTDIWLLIEGKGMILLCSPSGSQSERAAYTQPLYSLRRNKIR